MPSRSITYWSKSGFQPSTAVSSWHGVGAAAEDSNEDRRNVIDSLLGFHELSTPLPARGKIDVWDDTSSSWTMVDLDHPELSEDLLAPRLTILAKEVHVVITPGLGYMLENEPFGKTCAEEVHSDTDTEPHMYAERLNDPRVSQSSLAGEADCEDQQNATSSQDIHGGDSHTRDDVEGPKRRGGGCDRGVTDRPWLPVSSKVVKTVTAHYTVKTEGAAPPRRAPLTNNSSLGTIITGALADNEERESKACRVKEEVDQPGAATQGDRGQKKVTTKYSNALRRMCLELGTQDIPADRGRCADCKRQTGFRVTLCFAEGYAGTYSRVCGHCGYLDWPTQTGPSEAALELIESQRLKDNRKAQEEQDLSYAKRLSREMLRQEKARAKAENAAQKAHLAAEKSRLREEKARRKADTERAKPAKKRSGRKGKQRARSASPNGYARGKEKGELSKAESGGPKTSAKDATALKPRKAMHAYNSSDSSRTRTPLGATGNGGVAGVSGSSCPSPEVIYISSSDEEREWDIRKRWGGLEDDDDVWEDEDCTGDDVDYHIVHGDTSDSDPGSTPKPSVVPLTITLLFWAKLGDEAEEITVTLKNPHWCYALTYSEVKKYLTGEPWMRRVFYWVEAYDEWFPVLGPTHGIDVEPHMRIILLRLEDVCICPGFGQAVARLENHRIAYQTSLEDAEQAVNEATTAILEREVRNEYVWVVYWGQENAPAQVWQQLAVQTTSSRPGCVLGIEGHANAMLANDAELKIWASTLCEWIKVEKGEPVEVNPMSRTILVRGKAAEKLPGLGVELALLNTERPPEYDVGQKRPHPIDEIDVHGRVHAILADGVHWGYSVSGDTTKSHAALACMHTKPPVSQPVLSGHVHLPASLHASCTRVRLKAEKGTI
ncbi:hypothetical protein C8Q78DRAFT_991098 [Trametes maxima]|nr:hypothetical protein C8Q78DRAFT_991098 [Trametes maxima]